MYFFLSFSVGSQALSGEQWEKGQSRKTSVTRGVYEEDISTTTEEEGASTNSEATRVWRVTDHKQRDAKRRLRRPLKGWLIWTLHARRWQMMVLLLANRKSHVPSPR